MSSNFQILSADELRQLSYSELQKVAKKNGIRGNLKARKLISILSQNSNEDIPGISTPVNGMPNKLIKENLQEQFDKDMLTPLETPRRGTFTVTTPDQTLELNTVDTSPKSPQEDRNSALDMSNVTILRGSTRKALPRKVNFSSPGQSPESVNLKDQLTTPDAIESVKSKQVLFTSPSLSKRKKSSGVSYRTTPHPKTKKDSTVNKTRTPREQAKKMAFDSLKKQGAKTDSVKKMAAKNLSGAKKLKSKATPNFKKIHEKAFAKMESILDYQKRKLEYSNKKLQNSKVAVTNAKSKIPVPFSGIPFVPSTSNAKKALNFAKETSSTKKFDFENKKVDKFQEKSEKENKNKKQEKFDLKASLSRKLRYRPYTGRVKPLSETNKLNTSPVACIHKPKPPTKMVIENNRSKVRSALRGVRTNKRFELQMKNRMCN